MPFSEAEARLRKLATRIDDVGSRVGRLGPRYGKIEQDLAVTGQARGRPCISTFRSRIIGGMEDGLVDATIRLVGTTTDADYGTFTADDPESIGDGWYLVEIQIEDADTALDIYVNGPSSRFQETYVGATSFTRCGATSLPAYQPDPATGYYYLGNLFVGDADAFSNYPVSRTLNLTADTLYGTSPSLTLTWGGTGPYAGWDGCRVVSWPGYPSLGCGAVSSAWHHSLTWQQGFNPDDFLLGINQKMSGNCMVASVCSDTFTPGVNGGSLSASWTAPGVSPSSKFSAVFSAMLDSLTALHDYYRPGTTMSLTFQEP